ncbi:hypothetical protein LUZ61_016020 [Rhynchospora tenuis]|uniref:Uncharacterized protein n=1 Tax=Rhynchospora tenuis TaxID=198213 RepID=A0AAD5Z4Q8_9POAL|nr:hypothetical protein LUZ61_016020 [Rhynchospora tenuis]
MSKAEVENTAPEPLAGQRDWAGLHQDVLMIIFRKVGVHEVLLSTKATATYPRALANLIKIAVNWGRNFVEQLRISKFCDENHLEYIVERARNLKRLTIKDYIPFNERMFKTIGRLKRLEELKIARCQAPSGLMMKAIGTECPQLKRLIIKHPIFQGQPTGEGIIIRLGIPKTMVELKYLQLSGNWSVNFPTPLKVK